MPSRWRWIVVVGLATGLDLMIRFGEAFDFRRVMLREAVVFSVTAVILAVLLRYEPPTRGWPRAVRVLLVWFFGLGGLRPLLWIVGVPLVWANAVTLAVAVVAVAVWWRRRRRSRG